MAYKKEQVLAIAGLSDAQKERAEEWFKAAFRTQPKTQDAEGNDLRQKLNEITLKKTKTEGTGKNKTIVPVEIDNEDDVKEFLNDLITKHDKRLAANAKKKEAKEADEAKLKQLKELVESAAEYEISFDEVLEFVKNSFKEKKNAIIREKIAALQAQIED